MGSICFREPTSALAYEPPPRLAIAPSSPTADSRPAGLDEARVQVSSVQDRLSVREAIPNVEETQCDQSHVGESKVAPFPPLGVLPLDDMGHEVEVQIHAHSGSVPVSDSSPYGNLSCTAFTDVLPMFPVDTPSKTPTTNEPLLAILSREPPPDLSHSSRTLSLSPLVFDHSPTNPTSTLPLSTIPYPKFYEDVRLPRRLLSSGNLDDDSPRFLLASTEESNRAGDRPLPYLINLCGDVPACHEPFGSTLSCVGSEEFIVSDTTILGSELWIWGENVIFSDEEHEILLVKVSLSEEEDSPGYSIHRFPVEDSFSIVGQVGLDRFMLHYSSLDEKEVQLWSIEKWKQIRTVSDHVKKVSIDWNTTTLDSGSKTVRGSLQIEDENDDSAWYYCNDVLREGMNLIGEEENGIIEEWKYPLNTDSFQFVACHEAPYRLRNKKCIVSLYDSRKLSSPISTLDLFPEVTLSEDSTIQLFSDFGDENCLLGVIIPKTKTREFFSTFRWNLVSGSFSSKKKMNLLEGIQVPDPGPTAVFLPLPLNTVYHSVDYSVLLHDVKMDEVEEDEEEEDDLLEERDGVHSCQDWCFVASNGSLFVVKGFVRRLIEVPFPLEDGDGRISSCNYSIVGQRVLLQYNLSSRGVMLMLVDTSKTQKDDEILIWNHLCEDIETSDEANPPRFHLVDFNTEAVILKVSSESFQFLEFSKPDKTLIPLSSPTPAQREVLHCHNSFYEVKSQHLFVVHERLEDDERTDATGSLIPRFLEDSEEEDDWDDSSDDEEEEEEKVAKPNVRLEIVQYDCSEGIESQLEQVKQSWVPPHNTFEFQVYPKHLYFPLASGKAFLVAREEEDPTSTLWTVDSDGMMGASIFVPSQPDAIISVRVIVGKGFVLATPCNEDMCSDIISLTSRKPPHVVYFVKSGDGMVFYVYTVSREVMRLDLSDIQNSGAPRIMFALSSSSMEGMDSSSVLFDGKYESIGYQEWRHPYDSLENDSDREEEGEDEKNERRRDKLQSIVRDHSQRLASVIMSPDEPRTLMADVRLHEDLFRRRWIDDLYPPFELIGVLDGGYVLLRQMDLNVKLIPIDQFRRLIQPFRNRSGVAEQLVDLGFSDVFEHSQQDLDEHHVEEKWSLVRHRMTQRQFFQECNFRRLSLEILVNTLKTSSSLDSEIENLLNELDDCSQDPFLLKHFQRNVLNRMTDEMVVCCNDDTWCRVEIIHTDLWNSMHPNNTLTEIPMEIRLTAQFSWVRRALIRDLPRPIPLQIWVSRLFQTSERSRKRTAMMFLGRVGQLLGLGPRLGVAHVFPVLGDTACHFTNDSMVHLSRVNKRKKNEGNRVVVSLNIDEIKTYDELAKKVRTIAKVVSFFNASVVYRVNSHPAEGFHNCQSFSLRILGEVVGGLEVLAPVVKDYLTKLLPECITKDVSPRQLDVTLVRIGSHDFGELFASVVDQMRLRTVKTRSLFSSKRAIRRIIFQNDPEEVNTFQRLIRTRFGAFPEWFFGHWQLLVAFGGVEKVDRCRKRVFAPLIGLNPVTIEYLEKCWCRC